MVSQGPEKIQCKCRHGQKRLGTVNCTRCSKIPGSIKQRAIVLLMVYRILVESMQHWNQSSPGTRLRPFNLDDSLDCAATGVRWAYYEYYRNEYEYDGILTCKDITKYNVIQTSLLWYKRVMSWADAICAPPTRFCQEFCRNLVHQKEKCLRWSLNGSNLR